MLTKLEIIKSHIQLAPEKLNEIYLMISHNEKDKVEKEIETLYMIMNLTEGDEEKKRKKVMEEEKLVRKMLEEEQKLDRQKREESEKESLLLAKKCEEEEKRFLEMRRKEKEENNLARCEICLDDLINADLLPLESCEHIYHPKCIVQHMRTQVKKILYIEIRSRTERFR